MIHNLSLLNQVDLFQYINILHHKNMAQFHETEYLFVNNRGIIYIMLGHIILTHRSLNYWLDVENTMWHQRSRHLWIIDGDHNTSFFHQKASN